ncbi:hypothetical protein [Methylobacterium sp. P1-11]|uniref:hypothetical protein n=1 Tax=Methylobacterium sp. P1-11 TaxID=2024616 RepID=UPI001FEFA957|nr:hypothetical protein [Methylobacterium sp. P1-11]
MEDNDFGVSSLMDAWVKLQNMEANGERTSTLYVIPSRGMSQSNQIRECLMSSEGIQLMDAYIGPSGVLAGTARLVEEAQERAAAQHRDATERRLREMARHRSGLERQIEDLMAALEAAVDEEESPRAEDGARGCPRAGAAGVDRTTECRGLGDTATDDQAPDTDPDRDPGHYHLRLYVPGQTAQSVRCSTATGGWLTRSASRRSA